jgi:hypothetical protein
MPLQNFRANPYFEDAKLTKIFKFSDEGTTSVSGTQPKWKAGMVRILELLSSAFWTEHVCFMVLSSWDHVKDMSSSMS